MAVDLPTQACSKEPKPVETEFFGLVHGGVLYPINPKNHTEPARPVSR